MPLLKYVYDTYETTQNKIRIIRMDELWPAVQVCFLLLDVSDRLGSAIELLG